MSTASRAKRGESTTSRKALPGKVESALGRQADDSIRTTYEREDRRPIDGLDPPAAQRSLQNGDRDPDGFALFLAQPGNLIDRLLF
jgi:hypothetical protein